jgi:uncharacterized protein (TIGR02217 family)
MSNGFHEVRFPDRIAVGAVGGPAFSTTVIATASGYEQRNINWAEARGRWNVATGIKRREDVAELIEFFRCRMGRAYGFRFKDHTDFRALAQLLGTGDGSTTTLQLVKRYSSGPTAVTRTIRKPVGGTVKVSMPYAIAPGDAFTVHPGCDKRLATCRDIFANVLNFRGEPFVPGLDALGRYPDAQ